MDIGQDAEQIINEELSKISNKKSQSDYYMICCPFHDDSTPSCGINMSSDNKIPVGYFHCLGCGAKGSWNVIAEKMNLRKIKDWQVFNGNTRIKARKNLLCVTHNSVERLLEEIGTKQAIPWPKHLEWRGYDGTIITKLKGLYFNDRHTDELMLVFPIYINKEYRGGVRAFLEKQKNGTSYLTTKGNWVKSYGLLGYDYVKNVIRKYDYKFVVLVEGPRDFLRLATNKIPALAILGANSFDKKKLFYILNLSENLNTIYVLTDNDKGGNFMYKTIKDTAKGMIRVKRLKLPSEVDSKGKLIKMDPDNAPMYVIKQIKKAVHDGL